MVQCSFAQQMVFPGAEWETATPESQEVDSGLLQDAVDILDASAPPGSGSEELFIVRNGRVIWQGPNADNSHHTYSVTKSFATTALGLVIDDGLVTLDTHLADYIPSMAADYPNMTLRHCVTHTSGYVALNEGYPPLPAIPHEDPFTPGPPLFIPPGSQFAYANASLAQMMNLLTRVVGEPMQDLFQRRIGDIIGLEPGSWDWGHFETQDGLLVDGGGGDLGKGVIISAQDIARVGHLFLNQGNWDGQQLISRDWIDAATNVQVPKSVPLHPQSVTVGPGIYGYGWWIKSDSYFASGYEKNRLDIYPDTNLVIARLGHSTSLPGWSEFLRRVEIATIPASGTKIYSPSVVYMAVDDDSDSEFDDQGDSGFDAIQSSGVFLGEYDSLNDNGITRLITKFRLPRGDNTTHRLANAELRFYLRGVAGTPVGPVSLFHSVTDNDEEGVASDYEDASYLDTQLDLVQVTDPKRAYYSLDVTDQVLADYMSDEGNLLIAFRLQVDGAFFSEDNQSNAFQFAMPGVSAYQPQLVLTFVPEPGNLMLFLAVFTCSLLRRPNSGPWPGGKYPGSDDHRD
jgi:CubicO group peptidase (beta-lactamase class C family)